ncbi:MAG: hypothetical protein HY532_09535 [Chloroflexi bacterium]|nr:hypothetical protein [Chloroflexota bacterium]
MSRDELKKMIQDVVQAQELCIERATNVTNPQLDLNFSVPRPTGGTRDYQMRALLYNLVIHPREHAVHIGKILQQTGSPLAQPSETQAILMKAKEAWGELEAVLACLDDADLDREFEGHSLRSILTHLRNAHQGYANAIEKGVEAAKQAT